MFTYQTLYYLASVAAPLALVALHTRGRRFPIIESVLNLVVAGTDNDPKTDPAQGVKDLASTILAEIRKRLPHPDDSRSSEPVVSVVKHGPEALTFQVDLPLK